MLGYFDTQIESLMKEMVASFKDEEYIKELKRVRR